MMKKIKIKDWSEAQLYTYLRQQLQEGWRVKSFSNTYIVLESSTPQEGIFHFDCFPCASKDEKQIKRKLATYLEAYEQEGWHYISTYDSRHLFYNENQLTTIPKLNQLKSTTFKSYLKKELFSKCILSALLLFLLFLGATDLRFLIDWDSLIFTVLLLLTLVCTLLELFLHFSRLFTLKSIPLYTIDEYLQSHLSKVLKLNFILQMLIVFIIFPLSLIIMILNGLPLQSLSFPIVFLFAFQLLGEFLEYHTSFLISAQKVNGMCFFLSIAFVIVVAFLNDGSFNEASHSSPLITISDLTPHQTYTEYSMHTYYSSPFIPKTIWYEETSSLHELEVKSYQTTSNLLKSILIQYFLTEINGPSSTQIYPYEFEDFELFHVYETANQDLFIIAEKNSELIFIEYDNNLEALDYVANQISMLLTP